MDTERRFDYMWFWSRGQCCDDVIGRLFASYCVDLFSLLVREVAVFDIDAWFKHAFCKDLTSGND